ncbi:protein of unknown function DUF201 [Ferroglobus placidus DSM 10642]|uniref:ATP-grasp domain-containing protein n=1 Tax=Ferroglobus placidus (strain DSM 10642 / AEDII12DO) TaxID=589924 RepID=D3RZZ1_FERPA|nr:ATP-grasp domain-containing protein [Ferroglobus placidus]ADC66054.1 protein of unknown function DUF201 [Ferroglobus placidus DSM 10642]
MRKNIMVYDAADSPALPIARSLGRRGVRVHLASSKERVPAFYSKYSSKNHLVRSYREALEVALNENCELFIPLLPEKELVDLAKVKSKIENGIRIACGDYEAVKTLVDKGRITEISQKIGIPVPETVFPKSESDALEFAKSGEFILKFRIGSGGREVYVIRNESEYLSLKDELRFNEKDVLLQRVVEGKQLSISGICDKSNFVAAFVYERLRFYPYPFGPATYLKSSRNDDCLKYSEKLAEEVEYSGIINFDFIIDETDGKPKLIDVNPRFWGSVNAAAICGVDFPWLLYRFYFGIIDEIETKHAEGIHLRSFLEDFKSIADVLFSKKETKKEKIRNLLDFLNFLKYREFMFDFSDLTPNLYEIFEILGRRF